MAREKKANIVYLQGGTEQKRVGSDVDGIRFDFANGKALTISLADLPREIIAIAATRGIAEKVRDTFAGSESVGDAMEEAESIVERLLAGEWLAEREAAGPRPSMVVDAIIAAFADAGKTVARDAVMAKYTGKGTEEARKTALKNPQVKAHFERLRAEAAAKRAEEAQKAASGTAAEGAPDLASL